MKIPPKLVNFNISLFLRIIFRAFFSSVSLVYYNHAILIILIHEGSLILVFIRESCVESISVWLRNPLFRGHLTLNLKILVCVYWIIIYFRHWIPQIRLRKLSKFLNFFIKSLFLAVLLNFKSISKISPWNATARVFFEFD